MRLYTPNGLLYPVKVTRLLRQPGDDIEENAPLFDYEYKSKVLEGHINSKGHLEDKLVERTWPATFESELEGSLTSLNLTVGQVLTGKTLIADIEETCKHEVQFGGLCANCGKDMKEVKSYNSTVKGTDRATINTVHDRHGMHTVLVSQDETVRADEEAKRRLLDQRKLTLVVDLDQTVIQCCVEETVGEWKNDPSNPNFEALKNVASFRLPHDSKTYYLKFRPGLTDFLEEMSKYYEMHVYTMASRDYAQIVTNLIDPERKIFGTRVLSRDENGPEMRKALKRLFPVDTSMVVIIDDRGDVWQWSPNLIKVNAYDFFVGVGDINSSFLPKRQELEAKPKQPIQIEVEKAPDGVQVDTAPADGQEPQGTDKAARKPSTPLTPPLTPPAANGEVSAVDLMVSMAGGQDDNSMEEKKHEHDETLASQLADRPLLKKQKILDAADEEAKEGKDSPAVEEATEILREDGEKKEATPQDHPKYRHNLLQDDDTELEHLGNNLRSVHDAFFAEFEKGVSAGDIGRVAELRPGKSKKQNVQDLQNLPDAAVIMQAIKSRVLGGVHLVFSGVVPLGVNVHTHDTVIWAKTFGATVTENITKKTTHVIASPERRTAKVRQAAKKGGRIAIVSSGWLFACFSQWQKVDENPFRIHSDAPLNGAAGLPGFEDKEAGTLSSSDEEAALTETEAENETDGEAVNGSQPTLEIDTDVEEELAKYAPHDGRADSSPTEEQQSEDWDALQAELNEFLGSEAEDSDAPEESDNESDRSAPSSNNSTPGNHKRKRDAEADDAPTSNPEGSRLQKRKKEAMSRTTSLNNMSSAGNLDGTVAVDEPAAADDLGSIDEEDGEDVDLEAALAAELEKDDDDGGEAEGES